MREILFKAKRVDDGEWVEGDVGFNNKGYARIWNRTDVFTRGIPVDPNTVCQYTGLRDKNGHRIFDGDYISYFEDGDVSPDMIVAWDRTKCCFYKDCVSEEGYPYRSPFDEIDIKHELLLLTGRNIHDTTEDTE